MASNGTPPPDDHHHPATARGVSIPVDFATPTPEGRARYEQALRDMVDASEQTEARVAQMRERERFFGPTDPIAVEDEAKEDEEDGDNSMSANAPLGPKDEQSIAAFLASDRGKAALAQMTPLEPEDANRMPGGSMSALCGQDFGPGPLQAGTPLWQVLRSRQGMSDGPAMQQGADQPPQTREWDKQSIAAFLASDRSKAVSKQIAELYVEEAVIENRMRATLNGNARLRPADDAHPIDPNGGGRGSSYSMADANPAPPHPNRLPEQHARDVRAEKMAHIEQCIKIVGDSTINAFDHVRIGRMIAGLVGRMERGELKPDECERLHAISASYDRLVVTFVSPLHHRRGRPRKQARTHRRGKPDARMAPTEPSAAAASDRSRMDAQPRPKKGAWPTFYCKRCPINGRATANQLPYGTLSRDVLCDTCAVQMHAGDALAQAATGHAAAASSSSGFSRPDEQVAFHEATRQAGEEARAAAAGADPPSPPPPMIIHPSGDVDNYDDHAYLKACLPLIYGPDWERTSNAVIAEFRAQAATTASHLTPSDDGNQQRMALDAECVAAMQADERAIAASRHVWDTNPVLRDRETVGLFHTRKGQTSKHLEMLTRLWKENQVGTGPSEFSRRMQAMYNEHTQQQQHGGVAGVGQSRDESNAQKMDEVE